MIGKIKETPSTFAALGLERIAVCWLGVADAAAGITTEDVAEGIMDEETEEALIGNVMFDSL